MPTKAENRAAAAAARAAAQQARDGAHNARKAAAVAAARLNGAPEQLTDAERKTGQDASRAADDALKRAELDEALAARRAAIDAAPPAPNRRRAPNNVPRLTLEQRAEQAAAHRQASTQRHAAENDWVSFSKPD